MESKHSPRRGVRSTTPSFDSVTKDTTYTYELVEAENGVIARCKEIEVEAIGATSEAAIDSLRDAIALKLNSVEAVAPPPIVAITFRLVEGERESLGPMGPGDPRTPTH